MRDLSPVWVLFEQQPQGGAVACWGVYRTVDMAMIRAAVQEGQELDWRVAEGNWRSSERPDGRTWVILRTDLLEEIEAEHVRTARN